jgi:hypothetical protein
MQRQVAREVPQMQSEQCAATLGLIWYHPIVDGMVFACLGFAWFEHCDDARDDFQGRTSS